MPTPAVPTLTLCDQLVAVIAGNWKPASPDVVRRDYDLPVIPKSFFGRQVVAFPAAYQISAATRGQDGYEHRVTVLTVERYPDAGVPLVDWADTRVEFVFTQIVKALDFARTGALRFAGRTIWTREIAEVEVYDTDMLVSQRLFWCPVDFTFGEIL